MRLKLLFILIFSAYLDAGKITIAVAANVSYAIDDLKKEFNRLYPDTKVQVILGSTGKLTAQIKHGAPYQILMGANMKYPEALYAEDFAVTRPLVYAQGSLAYLSSKKRDFSNVMELLKSDKIEKIAVANPKTAPYGIATAEALKNAKIFDEIEKKFVYGESISQTVTYATKATDIGFIAKSSLFSPHMAHFKKGENWADVEATLYTPINQGIVILKEGEKSAEVSAFYAFIMSKRAKKIFEAFGYIVP
ncbi:molybdate ABC transporter substrate-binding protein [Sulfurovum sp. bin170]|uniref:molybdate ABC transporter substrate-binding protein n=1 Tax=Sulfurovum sp. bin170 TaxID=2695268 RepID=UPI0013DEC792|nr:molybdate ABC transporter substrate-binding protein [Sulfurovum sp. bin170]NEW61470.1 molybdate ABC transporter substrate-binding protein [Sulfurovum sp. bin170]